MTANCDVTFRADLSGVEASMSKLAKAAKRDPSIGKAMFSRGALWLFKTDKGLNKNGEIVCRILPTAKLKRLLAKADEALA
jgi:hypothetical protein